MKGNEILARELRRQEVDDLFFLMGGPLIDAANACLDEGIRMLDVRMEQCASMMANAYSRLTRKVGVCMAASGPGTVNLLTGIANAYVDGAPVLAIGGASSVAEAGLGAFQELDQLALARPITKWAERCYEARRIPELVAGAFREARGGRPGPVYLDLPGDVLYQDVDEETIVPGSIIADPPRPAGDGAAIERAVAAIASAERPVLIHGSGVIWSDAHAELRAFVEQSGIPFYATPQARGAVPDDHELSFLAARSMAFRNADCVILLATRMNYVVGYGRPPRLSPEATFVQVDIDATEIGRNRPVQVGVVGDAKLVLQQLVDAGGIEPERYAAWVTQLRETNREKLAGAEERLSTDQTPIHPLRLCKEIRDFMDRDAVLCADGQEILNYARQSIQFAAPGHSLNSGPFGTMGVGLPFALGAKVARPDAQVIALHGDGSFGINGFELDTAVRHDLAVITVISNNGGWTALDRFKAGRDLGYGRYHEIARDFGCHAEFVQEPDEIRPALERARDSGRPAVVNVITDPNARAPGAGSFTSYVT